MDKVTIIRSIVGMEDRHETFQTYTGRLNRNQPPGGWPAMVALLAKLQGSGDPAIPAYLGLAPKMGHVPWSDNGVAGYPGSAHAPFEINKGGGKEDMILNGITLERFADLRHSPFREARLQPDSSASPRLSPTRRKGIQSRGAAAFTASVDAISLWA